MLKNILIIAIITLSTSCIIASSGTSHYKYSSWSKSKPLEQNSSIEQYESIIITKINNNILINNQTIKEQWDLLGTSWTHREIAPYDLFYIDPSDNTKQQDFFKVESGNYFLNGIGNIIIADFDNYGFGLSHNKILTFSYKNFDFSKKLLPRNIAFISPKNILDQNSQPPLASFSANSNEIIYIGDLAITTSVAGAITGNINFEVKDNYDEAVKNFRKKYPQFKNKKIIKRLIKFGSLVDKDGNVEFSVPPREFLLGKFRKK